MTPNETRPRGVARTGALDDCSLRRSENSPEFKPASWPPNRRAGQEAHADLFSGFHREIAATNFRIAASKLETAAILVERGDNLQAWDAIDMAEGHLADGAAALRELEGAES